MRTPLLELHPGEVHVWCARLNPAEGEIRELSGLLSPDERSRAARFLFDRDRERFTVARGILRRLLAGYTGLPADHLRFLYGEHGKPRLQREEKTAPEFNLSHSGEWAVYSMALKYPLGIDIERMRPADRTHRLKLARRFFSESEFTSLTAQPETRVEDAFFTCWARKEAYIKLHGLGLSLPLARFSVNVEPDEPARLTATPWQPADLALTQIHDLPAATGYRAALAFSTYSRPLIRQLEWPNGLKGRMTVD